MLHVPTNPHGEMPPHRELGGAVIPTPHCRAACPLRSLLPGHGGVHPPGLRRIYQRVMTDIMSLAQLHDTGLSSHEIRRRVRDGELHRVHPGYFTASGTYSRLRPGDYRSNGVRGPIAPFGAGGST